MNVIFDTADFDGFHFVLARDAAEERPEPIAQCRCDKGATFFRAKDAVVVGTDIGHAGYSAVPSGLVQFQTVPGVETPGYCRLSLRDISGGSHLLSPIGKLALFARLAHP